MAATEDYYGGNKGLQGTRLGSELSFRECVHACTVVSDSFATAWTAALQALLSMDFPGKHTGMGCHVLLQGIFPTQGQNLLLLSPTVAGGFFPTTPPGKPLGNRQLQPTTTNISMKHQSHTESTATDQRTRLVSRNQGLIPGVSDKAESSQPSGVPPGGKSVLTAYLDGERFLKIYSSL